MRNGNVFEKLWRQQATIGKLVMDGKRDPEEVSSYLQVIIDEPKRFKSQKNYWPRIYKLLGMAKEYQGFIEKSPGFSVHESLWLFPVLKGLTCSRVIHVLRRLGVLSAGYDDIDNIVTVNDRDPNRDGSYVVSFRANQEADQENMGLSANKLNSIRHKGITLLERLLLGLFYFLQTRKKQHLDVQVWTLCSGSRCSNGEVPHVHWLLGIQSIGIDWCAPNYCSNGLRSRSVVSSASVS